MVHLCVCAAVPLLCLCRWSLGTLLYEMVAGYPPFYDKNRQMMYRKILTAEFSAPEEMSPDAASLCRLMLAREPTERLGYRGAAEVRGCWRPG